jgi:hypothetical protein
MDRIVRCQRTIPRPPDQRTSLKPPDQRSWSSKDARATHASRGSHRQRRPRLARPLERPMPPVATTAEAYNATVVATGPRVHHRRLPTHLGSVVVARSWVSAATGYLPRAGTAAGHRDSPPLTPEGLADAARTPEESINAAKT